LFDGFSDVIMGFIVDNTKHKSGKARPWVLRSAVPLAVTLVLLFSVPGFSKAGNALYLFIMYNLTTTVFYTMYAIPHGTQVALITQDQYERSILNIFRMVLGTTGALLVNIFTVDLVNNFGGGADAWRKAFVIYGIIAAIAIILSFYFTEERVTPKKAQKEKITFKVGFKALLFNKYWRTVLLLGILTYGIMALSGINIYYVTYILGNQKLMGTLMIFYFASSIIGMIGMAPIIKKLGKRNTVYLGFLIYLVGTILILINPYNENIVYIGLFVKGLGLAPLVGSLPSFIVTL
jgi:GPH family glycoside/pentoside/hexuronide:cation symporter